MLTKLEAARSYILDKYNLGEDFRFDLLSRKIQINESSPSSTGEGERGGEAWRNLTDKDICTMACECAVQTGANVTDREIRIVLGSDIVRNVHPLREWLNNLPAYDAFHRFDWIGIVADQVTVAGDEQEQLRWKRCFKKWFVAMVASWLQDDIVNHQVLVLIGRQGIYKTTWLEHLMPTELREYCSKLASVRELSKDDRIRIAEFGLINLDEIDAATPRELNALKSVITSADVNERAAYGHTKERRIRCASFCASGNNRQFLTDDTGNRRWLPFEVEHIENPYESTILYPYLYAQAVHLATNGFNYWFDLEDIKDMEQHTEAFHCTRNEEELLSVYFTPCEATEPRAKFMTASEIHARLKNWGNIENPMPLNKFSELLLRGGYIKKKLHGGIRGFIVKEVESQPIRNAKLIHDILTGADGAYQ